MKLPRDPRYWLSMAFFAVLALFAITALCRYDVRAAEAEPSPSPPPDTEAVPLVDAVSWGSYAVSTTPRAVLVIQMEGPERTSADPLAMVTITRSGKVFYGPDYDPDRAAELFWQAMGERRPCK